MIRLNQLFKYLDIFGTKCSFFVEKTPKLYSVTGGLLSIITFFSCFIIFIYTSLDNFKRTSPIINISSVQPAEYHKIKFGKEKIWIPWRIKDYSNHFVNHTNIFYPFIYNYYSINKTIGTGFEFKVKQLNYTLCNQTSFINKSEIFTIDSSLDELYCIEMDDVDVGGSWSSDYISYIEFDLYLCKKGIDYDENNPDCTRYDNISQFIGKNNSLTMSLYYPIVQFKANETVNPMTIIYRERFYHISRYSNKIDRIFLQKNILKDDLGWFTKKYNETSYWGLNNFQGDSYFTGDKKDLMNEGSTSRVYSFNIYLEPVINTYYRSYKKIYIIFSEFIPLMYMISFIFNLTAKFCKFYTINKKFSEFLFINVKEKTDNFDKKIKEIKQLNEKLLNINNKKNLDINAHLSSQKNNIFNNKLNDIKNEKDKNSFKDNSLEILKSNYRPREMQSSKSNDLKDNKVVGRNTIKTYFNSHNRDSSLPNHKVKRQSAKKISLGKNTQIRIQSLFRQIPRSDPHRQLIHKNLFPSRYYFYVIFIKNLDLLKKTKCVSNKFSKTYMFISRLLDVYSYLDLLRQFNVFKALFLNERNMNYIEKNRKINIGEISFMRNISDCIDNNNFRIFGRLIDND